MEKSRGVVISAFIKNKEGKYLAVFDPKIKFWRVPGGRNEFGEKAEDTITREAKEELNIEVEIIRFLGFGQDRVIVRNEKDAWRTILYYETRALSEDIQPDEKEIAEYKWVTFEELKKLFPLEPALEDMLQRFDPLLE